MRFVSTSTIKLEEFLEDEISSYLPSIPTEDLQEGRSWLGQERELLQASKAQWLAICMDRYLLHQQDQQRRTSRGYQLHVQVREDFWLISK